MTWLPTLITETPEEGFDIAIKLSRMAVKKTQPDDAARARMRPDYANNADSLTMASHVVAANYQTVAAANNYWRNQDSTRLMEFEPRAVPAIS
ncbi:MAG: hexameric tyrosine-coordinated heme protein [Pseudomonadota bacterium]